MELGKGTSEADCLNRSDYVLCTTPDVEDEDLGTLHYHFGNSTGVLHFSEDGTTLTLQLKTKS
jgi:hypothetical protein